MKLDKSNRSYSLLRYLLVICTKDLADFFAFENPKSYMNDIIYNYFDHNEKQEKRTKVKLISIDILPNHIKIIFQTRPTLKLVDFIGVMKSSTSFKFFQRFPDLRIHRGIWSNGYLLLTQGQPIQSHVKFFLDLHRKKMNI